MRDRPGFLLAWTPPEVPSSWGDVRIPTIPCGYLVEYRLAGGDWKLLADLPLWQTSLETTKLESGKSYDFRIMAKAQAESVPTSLVTYRPLKSLYPGSRSAIISKPIVSGPHMLPKQAGMFTN